MARLPVYFSFLLISFSLITISYQGDPSYSECKPHIDATILDLAAKAVQAGAKTGETVQPCSSPSASTEQTSTEPRPQHEPDADDDDYEVEEPPPRQYQEPASPAPPPTPVEQPPPPPPPPVEQPPPPPLPIEQPLPPPPPVQQQPPPPPPVQQQPPPPPPVQQQPPPPPPPVQQQPPPPASEPTYQPPPPVQQQPPPPASEPTYQPPPPPSSAHYANAPESSPPPEKMGLFDKFMKVVFGYSGAVRNPKFAQPWNTHPEFKKKVSSSEEQKPKVSVSEPGVISKFINKCVGVIFNIKDEGTKDPKWAQPWQTHKEHTKKVEKETSDKPKEPAKTFIHLEFVNKLVEFAFGYVPRAERDPKWAQPWNTHEEHKKSQAKATDKPKTVVIQEGKGGIINYFVSYVFEVPKGERDKKWAQPWQTHEEHKKSPAEKKEPTKAVSTEPGFISKSINKFVGVVFGLGKIKEERDPKWAKPWQTHEEHAKKKVAEQDKKPVIPPGESDFLGLKKLINTFVQLVFGKDPTIGVRDPKWAQPWQTHVRPGVQIKTPPSHAATPPPPPPPVASPAPPPPPPVAAPAPPPVATPAPPPPAAVPAPPPPPPVAKPAPPPPPPVEKPAPPPPPPVEKPAPPPPPPVEKPAPPPPPPPVEKPAPPPPPPVEKPAPPPLPKQEKAESFPSDSQAQADTARRSAEQVASAPKAPVKQVLEEVAASQQEEQKKEKIIEHEEQIVVVPSAFRARDHVESILGLDEAAKLSSARTDPIADATLRELKKVYETAVKPLETIYKYQDISNRQISDAELFGTPLVLLLGPYSTGKSTFINYLLGIDFTKRALKTGTPPSHGVFRIVKYGETDRDVDGTDLSGHWTYGFLQKFGQNFIDQLQGKEVNSPLLKKLTFVEAPGILEMRRPGERLYPFNDVIQWFIDRADLILVMFDYTKLDAGYELEAVLDQLKGREAQTRILLNKADQVPPEELIRIQGSLFWNLSPLLGVSSPPVVYAGSFASLPYRPTSPAKLFHAQEEALLHDIAKAVNSRVDNRIAIARRHAVRVRNHAQMVDTYLTTFYKNKGFLTSKHKLADEIIENPHAYNIYEGVSLLTNISRYDLPDAEVYRDFFRIHSLYNFRTLRETCTYLTGCPLEKLDNAINKQLPELLNKHRRLVEAAAPGTKLPDPNIRPGGVGAKVAHTHHSK